MSDLYKLESRDGKLYAGGKLVIKGWESFSGWYWFATELLRTQDSDFGDKVIKDDKIYFGLVQGFETEWGDFSEGELKMQGNMVWEIPEQNLHFSGRRT